MLRGIVVGGIRRMGRVAKPQTQEDEPPVPPDMNKSWIYLPRLAGIRGIYPQPTSCDLMLNSSLSRDS